MSTDISIRLTSERDYILKGRAHISRVYPRDDRFRQTSMLFDLTTGGRRPLIIARGVKADEFTTSPHAAPVPAPEPTVVIGLPDEGEYNAAAVNEAVAGG